MKISYRPEIDGLRALAVLSIIFYHTEFRFLDYELFKGGFIGVDIFFVISGYLITSIIFKDLNFNNTFSFKYFYERRIRRILPVLILVILTSFIFTRCSTRLLFCFIKYTCTDFGALTLINWQG